MDKLTLSKSYEILDVKKNSTQEEIKKAYKKLALKYHPDRPNGDENTFKKVGEAYEVIMKSKENNNANNANNVNLNAFFKGHQMNDFFSNDDVFNFVFNSNIQKPPEGSTVFTEERTTFTPSKKIRFKTQIINGVKTTKIYETQLPFS